MEQSSQSPRRFDSLIRSERYFTATLLPAVLFHNNLKGVERFLELVEERAKTERAKSGEVTSKSGVSYDFSEVEIITEFHIRRDLTFANFSLEESASFNEGEREKRDAPDLVIVAGQEMIVCEGKFFSEFGSKDLNKQLSSQRKQVRYLFEARPAIRAYRHVAIIPFSPPWTVEADAVLTWDDIWKLAGEVLGSDHYVTLRLRIAIDSYISQDLFEPGVREYEETPAYAEMCAKCEELGNEISVGHHGGLAALSRCSLTYAMQKPWKHRGKDNLGATIARNWLGGDVWLKTVLSLEPDLEPQETGVAGPGVLNYDGKLSFADMCAKCEELGDEISVGHDGGLTNLTKRSLTYAMQKQWKYRGKDNMGTTIGRNWLPGAQWLEVVEHLKSEPEPPATTS